MRITLRDIDVAMQIENIDQLIEAFGGASELGRRLAITQEAVSMWRMRGEIPTGWHLRLLIDARSRGWEIAPDVFGFRDPSDIARFRAALGCMSSSAA
jgi:hypothetical protein